MERFGDKDIDRDRALSELRQTMSKLGKHGRQHARIHSQSMEHMHQLGRALEGLCGYCGHCAIREGHIDGKQRPYLRCDADHSPVDIYRATPLGEQAKCSDYEPIAPPQEQP